jgi:hypothetical protein
LIKDVGYNHGKAYFHGLMKSGSVKEFLNRVGGPTTSGMTSSGNRAFATSKPSSFVDLARLVCQVRDPVIVMEEEEGSESEFPILFHLLFLHD